MNNNDFKEERDYIDVISDNKKEMRAELFKSILKAVLSLGFAALIGIGAYIGVKNLIPKIKDSKILETTPVVEDNTEVTDSSTSSDTNTTVNTTINKCVGTYEGVTAVGNKSYSYTYILNDDESFTSSINDNINYGSYSVNNNVITFNISEVGQYSYKTDNACSYIEVNDNGSPFKLTKK